MTDWATTPQGYYIRNAWDVLTAAYQRTIPGHVQQLRTLSTRPINSR